MNGILVRLLGAVEIAGDKGWTRAGPAKRNCVLAVLAISPRTPVSLETLVTRVWGTDPPSSAHSTLYGHIAHLRTALKGCPGEATIRKSGPDGYLLDIDVDQIDLHAMRSLAARARDHALKGDGAQAVAEWRQACDLMRGEALAGINGEWAAEIRSGVRREHVTMLTERFTTELDLGQHSEIVEELSAYVAQHPLAEGLVECLMIALYRGGRQAEALDAFANARARLGDRLGADPGSRLQDLHLRILNQDPALASPSPVSEPPAERRSDASVAPASTTPPPAQLPAAPRLFAGRAAEMAELDHELHTHGGARLCTVTGPGGIGKSWLALHWAHLRRDAFVDGQLYVNLHGFDPGADPASPEAALRGLLETLGVKPTAIPTSLDAMAGLYRSVIAGKRMLILVDDVRSSRQVIPLLPGDGSCFTVVTGRPSLTALAASHGARCLRVNTLSETESREALARQVGTDRMTAEPEATSELIDTCAGLPLALGILAARAAVRPDLPLTALAENLRDDTARLDALDTGELSASLRAVLEGSLAALSPDAARLFALLGLAPGSDADRYAIASLAGVPLGRADKLLRELETANLVEQCVPCRYRMHDLTRLYAAEYVRAEYDANDRTEALHRIVGHYFHTAAAARLLIQPNTRTWDFGEPLAECVLRPIADADSATQWFTDMRTNIMDAQQAAVERGWHKEVWGLAWGQLSFHIRHRVYENYLLTWQRADVAAERLDSAKRALAQRCIGEAHAHLEDDDAARVHLSRAIELADAVGDFSLAADCHHVTSRIFAAHNDYQNALRYSTRALELARHGGLKAIEIYALNAVGWHRAHLGEYEAARSHCEEALERARSSPDGPVTGHILDSLGYITFHNRQYDDAIVYYGEAIETFRRHGVHAHEPLAMVSLADVREALGHHDDAIRLRREAAELYESQGFTEEAARLRKALADPAR